MSIDLEISSSAKATATVVRRKANRWDLACLAGGLLSVSALLGPAYLVVPGVTALLGLVAFGVAIRSKQSNGSLLFVAVGLLLAAGFGGVGMRFFFEVDPLSEREAKRFAEYWMSRLQANDFPTALMLTVGPSNRPSANTDLKAYLANHRELARSLQLFHEDPVARILHLGIDSEYQYEKTVVLDQRQGEAIFWYQVEYTDFADNRRRARAEIGLHYEFGGPDQASGWWVQRAHLPLGFEFVERPD